MNKKLRFLIFITIVFLLIGTLPSSSALAGGDLATNYQGAGETKLNQIKANPCGSFNIYAEGIPIVTCSGWAGATSLVTVPLSYWETVPDYPLVNYPFYIALGTVSANGPGTNVPYYFPSRDVTYPYQIDFEGLRTEIKLVAIESDHGGITTGFNGTIEVAFGDHGSVSQGTLLNRYFDSVEADLTNTFGQPPEPASAAYLPYYELAPGTADTVVLRAITTNSSYRATNPTMYRGEPAYRIVIDSYYRVQTRVTWQDYRLWVKEPAGYKSVCVAGPSSSGDFDCVTTGFQPGHTVAIQIDEWKWGAPQGNGESNWVFLPDNTNPIDISVNSVRWPDGSIHDHMPLVVYQSQPILQQP